MEILGVQMSTHKEGYMLYLTNLPEVLRGTLPYVENLKISFKSPTPDGYYYLGRNHKFIEQLCQYLLAEAFNSSMHFPLPTRTKYVLSFLSVIYLLKASINNLDPGQRGINRIEEHERSKIFIDSGIVEVTVILHKPCAFKEISALVHTGIDGSHQAKFVAPLFRCTGPTIML